MPLNIMEKPKDVDSYLANSGQEARPKLEELRKIIKSTIPKAEEGISWGMPFYKYYGFLAAIAEYKKHVSFQIADSLQNGDRQMLEEKRYATGLKRIQIKFDQEVPTTMIRQILKTQAKMNEAKKAAK